MNDRLVKLGFGVVALGAIAAPVALLTNAQAQQPGLTQGNPGQRPPGGEFGQRGQFPGMGMGMMGGGATMIDDANNLYVMRGNTIFKIDKGQMRLTGHVDLPMPEPGPGFGGGQPGGFGGRGGQGGQGGQGGGFGGGQGGAGGQGGGFGGGQGGQGGGGGRGGSPESKK